MIHTSGFEQLSAETERQYTDALKTWEDVRPAAKNKAAKIAEAGRLILLGMGGSHWVNRIAEPLYRAAGIDATAHVLSEYMRAPLPGAGRACILTSQSGSSGEILRYLESDFGNDYTIGFTLNPDSPLGQLPDAVIGAGGVELAYAATRSLLVTIVMHAAILDALGLEVGSLLALLQNPPSCPVEQAENLLAGCSNAVFVGRGALQGIADAAALSFMELARIPVLGLEAGQFRHGPFEMIDDSSAVVFLRGQGKDGDNIDGLARECISHGITPAIFDFSGEPPVENSITISLPAMQGLAAAAGVLPLLQHAVIGASARMVANVGMPLRSTKITSGEAVS